MAHRGVIATANYNTLKVRIKDALTLLLLYRVRVVGADCLGISLVNIENLHFPGLKFTMPRNMAQDECSVWGVVVTPSSIYYIL